jgi:hypothetical protein
MPVRLTDEQLSEIFKLTKPLAPACRDAFLRILAHELGDRADVGDGELFRVARAVIADNHLFEAPAVNETGRTPRRAFR